MKANHRFLATMLCIFTCSLRIGPAAAEDATLRAFVDGVMQAQLSEQTTIGATVAVVQDGKVLLSAGYGYADIANARPVDPNRTLFRVGSISKVVVWIALLQQMERAGVSLDEAVAAYVPEIELDERYAAPVTLRHLLTHSPGFEDRLYGLFTDSPGRVPPLVEYLQRNVPRQIWLPGEMVAYSNYGAALAARVVENTAGVPFNDYVQNAIFTPLKMDSTFSQESTDNWPERLAQGYVVKDRRPIRQPIEYVVAGPAGAMSASAADMARLMLELLDPNTSSLLTSDGKALLLERAQGADPALNGRTLGLYEMTQGSGERAVGHGGNTLLFHSRMVLWPGQHLGLFVSTNTFTGERAVGNLIAAFARHYGLEVRPADGAVDVVPAAVLGHYGQSRREFTGPLKVLGLMGQLQVTRAEQGKGVRIAGAVPPANYTVQGDDLFYATDGVDRWHFVASSTGPDRLRSSAIPVVEFVRLQWFERADLNGVFAVLLVLMNLLVLVRLPYTLLRPAVAAGPGPRSSFVRASLLAWLMAAAVLSTIALYVAAVPDPVEFMLRGYRRLAQLNWIWPGIALGAIAQVWFALMSWRRGLWWLGRRGFYSLAALLNLAFAGWLYYWNLQPFSVPVS